MRPCPVVPSSWQLADEAAVISDVATAAWRPCIDDGVPLPPTSRGSGAPLGKKFSPRLPFRRLHIGQSFFVPEAVMPCRKIADRVAAMSVRDRRTAERHRIRLALRAITEDQVPGTRVWRVG